MRRVLGPAADTTTNTTTNITAPPNFTSPLPASKNYGNTAVVQANDGFMNEGTGLAQSSVENPFMTPAPKLIRPNMRPY